MKTATLKKTDIGKCLELLMQAEFRVIAPQLRPRLESPDSIDVMMLTKMKFGEDHAIGQGILPLNGVKEFLFVKDEPLFAYEHKGKKVQITEVHHDYPKTVIFGVRPCDAASIGSLNAVFSKANAGFEDPFFTKRLENTTIVTYSCTDADPSCFCTSVGLAPDNDRGSDLHLTEIPGERLHIEPKTPAGEAVAKILEPLFQWPGDPQARSKAGEEARKKVTRLRNSHLIKGWLDELTNFDDEMWARLGEKCIGCGACTFMCPTCHCFDMVDENRGGKGYRVKFWDGCQFDHFTLHASGHNPRNSQYQRYRNRFSCKFKIYQDKFNAQGCVGCGRCIRDCPVNLDITEYMKEVDLKAYLPNAWQRDPDFE